MFPARAVLWGQRQEVSLGYAALLEREEEEVVPEGVGGGRGFLVDRCIIAARGVRVWDVVHAQPGDPGNGPDVEVVGAQTAREAVIPNTMRKSASAG